MGGSFNPPHAGHLVVADAALKRLGLDQLWWIVTPGNPLKSHQDLAPLDTRLAQVRKLARHPRMRVTAFEAELGSPYTAAMVAFLKRRHPNTRFVWVMGADSLAGLHRWQHWRQIAGGIAMAVADRPDWRLKALAGPAAQAVARRRIPEREAPRLALARRARWAFLTTRLVPQASSEIRRQRADD